MLSAKCLRRLGTRPERKSLGIPGVFPDSLNERLYTRRFESCTEGLSARELEVLRWLAQGQTVKEIAESMGLSPKTVANHQSAIKQKLDADTAIELMRRANELGLD